MAAYATRADLYSLAAPAAALGDVSTADQDLALEAASRKVDSYLRNRFDLPLTSVGMDIKEAVAKLAAWQILTVRGFNPEQGDANVFRDNYTDTIKWLEQISSGKVTPTNVVDSSDGENNTDATGTAVERSFVVQPYSESRSQSSFWDGDKTNTATQPGTVGPAKSRGW